MGPKQEPSIHVAAASIRVSALIVYVSTSLSESSKPCSPAPSAAISQMVARLTTRRTPGHFASMLSSVELSQGKRRTPESSAVDQSKASEAGAPRVSAAESRRAESGVIAETSPLAPSTSPVGVSPLTVPLTVPPTLPAAPMTVPAAVPTAVPSRDDFFLLPELSDVSADVAGGGGVCIVSSPLPGDGGGDGGDGGADIGATLGDGVTVVLSLSPPIFSIIFSNVRTTSMSRPSQITSTTSCIAVRTIIGATGSTQTQQAGTICHSWCARGCVLEEGGLEQSFTTYCDRVIS